MSDAAPADRPPDRPPERRPDRRPALAFPGQGVDPVDLGRILRAHDDYRLVDRLAAELGQRSWEALDLNDTRVAQPSVYCASVLQAGDHLKAAGGLAQGCALTFGHSMGELGALATAGAFSVEAGLELAVRRAAIGHDAQQRRPGAMAVVMRLDAATVARLCVGARRVPAEALGIAVVNGAEQLVVAGDAAAVDRFIDRATTAGGVARRLTIGGAYHSPLLADAVAPYADAIRAVGVASPRVPVLSCTTQRPMATPNDVVAALAGALVRPVQWVATLEAVRATGITDAVDVGPGATLANLARFTPVLAFTALSPARRPAS
jgi:[acyl-carrier-protein] S-malonyltransferase